VSVDGDSKLIDQLAVGNAVITVKADPSRRVTYGELIAGKKFSMQDDPSPAHLHFETI